MTKKKFEQKWVCPACGVTVKTKIKLSSPPTCSKHTGGGRLMREETDV